MVDFFDRIYAKINNNNKILEYLKFYSLLRFSVRLLANFIITIHFTITFNNPKYRLIRNETIRPKVIVSLTSFPTRIKNIWLVIETIFRQEEKPDMIILWLSKEQFKDINLLPKKLLKQRGKGLIIRLVEGDLRSHKKYFYTLSEFPNDIMITIDDDVFYDSKMIYRLMTYHARFPKCIICNHAHFIFVENNLILPYNSWKSLEKEYGPTNKILPVGIGGILYPSNSLNSEVLNQDIFKKYCFYADDIWLNFMSRLNNTLLVRTNCKSNYLSVINMNNSTLTSINVQMGLNDLQLKQIREFSLEVYHKDPFINI